MENIPKQFLCTKITIGCPHCINKDIHETMPWFFIDKEVYQQALEDKNQIRCQKDGCKDLFPATHAILSADDDRFRWPQDHNGHRLPHLWLGISCPSCMMVNNKPVRYIDIWGAKFLQRKRQNLTYPCPLCTLDHPARMYALWSYPAEPSLTSAYV